MRPKQKVLFCTISLECEQGLDVKKLGIRDMIVVSVCIKVISCILGTSLSAHAADHFTLGCSVAVGLGERRYAS